VFEVVQYDVLSNSSGKSYWVKVHILHKIRELF